MTDDNQKPATSLFPSYDGVQILWDEGREREFIPRAILEHAAGPDIEVSTVALTRAKGFPASYRYPATLNVETRSMELTYREPPDTWSPAQAEDLIRGTTVIRFAPGTRDPVEITWEAKGEAPRTLDRGTDWDYRPARAASTESMQRARIPRMVTERPDQAWLRAALLADRGQCLLTGTRTPCALEACHIVQVKDQGIDDPLNALLLRRDLHALFDLQLLRFENKGGKWFARIAKSVEDDVFRKLDGEVPGLEQHRAYLERRMQLEQDLTAGA